MCVVTFSKCASVSPLTNSEALSDHTTQDMFLATQDIEAKKPATALALTWQLDRTRVVFDGTHVCRSAIF